ncbi:peptidyl-prolyl cis-trans isomerase [Marinihelvus fidelis]|uniref:Peptidyl-prolyl cis-trans isomerase n=2 Tax=Marinihelvus fidelis TaxID=2613842 RepID=A0A5N0T7X3_9GAMM|nr:peptidyl-prolyl cis-trans isomerase [Marinihelvus fidelis]
MLSALAAMAVIFVPTAGAFECDPEPVLPGNAFPVVVMETSMGNVEVELDRLRAPATVNNFLRYVVEGSYDNTIFHRVIAGFVVQGGGYDGEFEQRPVHDPVMNESGNGLGNIAWTIAMARFSDPHSATSQFYFNVADNSGKLDPSSRQWGYTVFGTVIAGQDVLEKIAAVETGYNADVDFQDVPLVPVMLIKATVQ